MHKDGLAASIVGVIGARHHGGSVEMGSGHEV